jgi:hypothetical protein
VVIGLSLAAGLVPYEFSLRLLAEVLFGYRQAEIVYPENAFLDFSLLLPVAAYSVIHLAILCTVAFLQRKTMTGQVRE